MGLSLHSALVAAGLVGSGVVVGVPVALTLNSSYGGGFEKVSLSECNETGASGVEKVNLNSNQGGNVCWKMSAPTWGPSISLDKQKYTELFQKIWDNRTSKLETLTTDSWKSNCTEGKWSLSSTNVDKEGLGLCTGESDPTNQQWISVERKGGEAPKIEVCRGACFQSNVEPISKDQQKTLDPNKKTWNWYPIQFQIKSISL